MTKDQAAKLAQAYQWLSEEKEVQYLSGSGFWQPWTGFGHELQYRLKPEPQPLMECWANLYLTGYVAAHPSAEKAINNAGSNPARVAVHMREVRDEPNT